MFGYEDEVTRSLRRNVTDEKEDNFLYTLLQKLNHNSMFRVSTSARAHRHAEYQEEKRKHTHTDEGRKEEEHKTERLEIKYGTNTSVTLNQLHKTKHSVGLTKNGSLN